MLRWFLIMSCCFAPCRWPSAQASPQESLTAKDWIRQSAIPFDDAQADFGVMEGSFSKARVIALGEATHGQREVFEAKRLLTMHLIKKHGVRIVAYEASASKMLAANDYLSGKSDDRNSAMKGFGMLIWQIEENAALLDDLRAWNLRSSAPDQVRLIGIDAQDGEAAMKRLLALIGEERPETKTQIQELVPRSQQAIQELMTGKRENWDQVAKEIEVLRAKLQGQLPSDPANHNEYKLRVSEFLYSLSLFSSRGSRDQAMAELLMQQLDQAGAESRCVVWAHNGHVQLSPLAYLGSPDLAMGGHLAKRLGERYYALGVAFGEGEFQANAPDAEGKWGFRRYRLSAAPENSLEWTLAAAKHPRYLLDLRNAPKVDAVQQWLNTGHGQRWFGGYSVPEDCDKVTSDASKLLPTTPRQDFDGLLYLAKTEASRPLNTKLILKKDSP